MTSPTVDQTDESAAEAAPGPRLRWWRRLDPLTVVTLLAIGTYAVIGIGSPLLGLKVFAATDLLAGGSPYRDAGLAGTVVQNTYLNDTIDSYLPNTALFVTALYDGQFAAWNPYIIGGTPLGASPNLGLLNPIALPYFLLPFWIAPGYVKLLEIVAAVGGTFLFLRRVGLGRPAALLGGLVFASSGFMVAWTNWPHTRVAALIPWLFWALDRLVIRRRISDGVLVSVITAFMIFGGFPAVAGYGLLFGAAYLVVRTFSEYAGEWRRIVGVGLGALAAVVAGAALTAFQLVPFLSYMSAAHVNGREQTPGDHLQPESLVTAIAPWAMGSTDPSRPPFWYLSVNLVESLVYIGAAAAVLVVVALALPRAGRALLPRGIWAYLVAATGALLVVLYIGRFPLWLLQQLPVLFSENFVGRARSVLGFLLAALAAIGFQLLLTGASSRLKTLSWYAVAVWSGAGLLGAVAWWDARRAAYHRSVGDPVAAVQRVGQLNREMLLAVALVALAAALVGILWWTKTRRDDDPVLVPEAGPSGPSRWVRLTVAALLPVLVAGQALALAVPYWPRVDRDTFYPLTDTHRYLAEHLGHERFAGSGRGMYVGADSGARLRALSGHFFLNGRFAETIDGLPGRQFGDPPTYVNFPAKSSVVRQPVFDRLSVKYFVASTGVAPFGKQVKDDGDGTEVTLRPGEPLTLDVPGEGGGVRGIGLIPAAPFPTDANPRVDLTLYDLDGNPLASSRRLLYDLGIGKRFWIPIAGENIPRYELLTAKLTLRADKPLTLAGTADKPAVSLVLPRDDGLRLAYAGSAVVYQRLTALPRIRWASSVRVEADPERRVELVASGELGRREVVLDAPYGAADGAPATV
ncbi:MAG: hypothetical protein ACRDTM_14700, partial [Micromonosporaceae bacterium]